VRLSSPQRRAACKTVRLNPGISRYSPSARLRRSCNSRVALGSVLRVVSAGSAKGFTPSPPLSSASVRAVISAMIGIGKRSAICVQARARVNHRQRCDLRLDVRRNQRGDCRQPFQNEGFRSI